MTRFDTLNEARDHVAYNYGSIYFRQPMAPGYRSVLGYSTLVDAQWFRILCGMSSVQEIEDAVNKLSAEELKAFRTWFADFDADAWDRQFEQDVATGRLDALAAAALRHLQE